MNTYDYLHRRIWYDPHIRSWTMQCLDAAGNQDGDVAHTAQKTVAFSWLYGKPSKGERKV